MPFPVADAHCDFLYGAVQSGYDINTRQRDQVTAIPELIAGHVALQFFACWIDTALKTSPLHQCIAMIDAYRRMLKDNPDLTPFTRSFQPDQGRIATVLTVEGGEAVEGSLSVLRVLHQLGVRAMTLTWNESNELSGAAMQRSARGLTAIGREIVDEMNRIGVAVDVSHLSDRGIDDVLSRASRPAFASHSNARSVFASPRSLEDAHIREIARQSGVVGVNFFNKQLTEKPSACIDDIVRQIRHVVRIGGVDCCAIGSDFDGMQNYPQDLRSGRDYPKLMQALLAEGFSKEEVGKIAYWNLHRYIAQFV